MSARYVLCAACEKVLLLLLLLLVVDLHENGPGAAGGSFFAGLSCCRFAAADDEDFSLNAKQLCREQKNLRVRETKHARCFCWARISQSVIPDRL